MLEIACFSLNDALVAAKAGADRIEFCSNYELGGVGPDENDLQQLIAATDLPVFVMIRLRGGDFVYSAQEIENMRIQLLRYKALGAHGFVFGCLTKANSIDSSACRVLLEAADPLPCTFHRAIDSVSDYEASFQVLVDLQFSAVLSSGRAQTALMGASQLQTIYKKFGHKLNIIVGGGVRANNIKALRQTGCTSFHSAALDENTKSISIFEIKSIKTQLLEHEKN